MGRRVTIYDIAQATGVSTGTVSRALNGSGLIGSETAGRIRAAGDRLGYRKRPIRRQLERSVLTIKLILPRREQPWLHLFYDPVDLIRGLTQAIAPTQAHLVVAVAEADLDLFAHKKGGDTDAVIFAFCAPSRSLLAALDRRRIPCLLLNRSLPGRSLITCDHRAAGETLIARLHAANPALRPCFLDLASEAAAAVARERYQGIAAGCATRALPFGDDDRIAIADPTAIEAALPRDLFDRGYNAVLAFNDLLGIGFLQAAREAGIRVPDDLAVTGFDDSPIRHLIRPALTTVSLPVHQLGLRAGAWVLRTVVERDPAITHETIPGHRIDGDTVGPG